METVMARLRYCRRRVARTVLVHDSGVPVRDADGGLLIFSTEQAAADFAQAFLCEPHRVVSRSLVG